MRSIFGNRQRRLRFYDIRQRLLKDSTEQGYLCLMVLFQNYPTSTEAAVCAVLAFINCSRPADLAATSVTSFLRYLPYLSRRYPVAHHQLVPGTTSRVGAVLEQVRPRPPSKEVNTTVPPPYSATRAHLYGPETPRVFIQLGSSRPALWQHSKPFKAAFACGLRLLMLFPRCRSAVFWPEVHTPLFPLFLYHCAFCFPSLCQMTNTCQDALQFIMRFRLNLFNSYFVSFYLFDISLFGLFYDSHLFLMDTCADVIAVMFLIALQQYKIVCMSLEQRSYFSPLESQRPKSF